MFVIRQLVALLERGHEVSVYAREPPEDLTVVHPEVAQYDLLGRTVYVGEGPSLDSLESYGTAFRKGAHDVVHVQFGHTARHFLFVREAVRAPLVVTFRGYDFSGYPNAFGADCYREVFALADAVTYNCAHARARLEELGCPPGKLTKFTSALDVGRLPFRERRREPGQPVRLVTVARLVEKKGLEVGLLALAAAREEGLDLRWDIVGEGPLGGRLESLAGELGLAGIVRLLGPQDAVHVRAALADAHLFLLPSLTAPSGDQEGTPVSLMEAQASGLPVLSTLHSGIPEVVADGASGILVAEGDPAALAASLLSLVARESDWPAMGRRGRDHVALHYDLADWTGRLVSLYEEVAAGFA